MTTPFTETRAPGRLPARLSPSWRANHRASITWEVIAPPHGAAYRQDERGCQSEEVAGMDVTLISEAPWRVYPAAALALCGLVLLVVVTAAGTRDENRVP